MTSPTAPRTDLSRFGINIKLPVSFAALVIDLFEATPDCGDAKEFIDRFAQLARSDVDLSTAPARFLFWLLQDPRHGLINITKQPAVKKAICMVAHNIILPLVHGTPLLHYQFKSAAFAAKAAQNIAWCEFKCAPSLPLRTEWMVACAASDAGRADDPCALVSALHSAAVAWSASRGTLNQVSVSFYQAARDQVLAILSPPAAQPQSTQAITPDPTTGDRVEFDSEHGPQTGKVIDVNVDHGSGERYAVVRIDGILDSAPWTIPVGNLQRIAEIA